MFMRIPDKLLLLTKAVLIYLGRFFLFQKFRAHR
jgi:hypothetical protein